MKKLSFNKPIFVTGICICLVIIVVAALIFSKTDDKSVAVIDSQGNEVAKVSRTGDSFEIAAENDAYSEYVEIAVNEAVELYAEKCNMNSDEKYDAFFENVLKVNTHLETDYLLKIKDTNFSQTLQSDTSFSCVMVSPQGKVLAVYGLYSGVGSGYSQKRTYAGSAIKPLSVYSPLIETGKATYSTVFHDSPIKKIRNAEGKYVDWPSNASGEYSGTNVTLSEALNKSLNTVAVRGLQELTVSESVSFLEGNFGINLEYEKATVERAGEEEILGSIALGYLNDGVSPVDMAGYYQIFLNGGTYTSPYTVSEIEISDGEVYSPERKTKRVLSEETSSIMRQLLKGVVSREGTAYEAYVEDLELAGKSGTSSEYADNWFVGFTPDYIFSVWHGFNNAKKNSASELFSEIAEKLPASDQKFSISDKLVRKPYCKKTGGIKGENCGTVAVGYYNKDNIPQSCTECKY